MTDFISSHVLDQATGVPGEGIRLALYYQENSSAMMTATIETPTSDAYDNNANAIETWVPIGDSVYTNKDGRARVDLPVNTLHNNVGVYKMIFYTQPYFQRSGTPNFYPRVEIIFRLADPTIHYHVPLLLSPYGYSTYKGS
jgi:5-hydroxyisourate hydrolase